MTGLLYASGRCLVCSKLFGFNPELVPSINYPVPDGPKRPICEDCITEANEVRTKLGKRPHLIPSGAYEPMEA